MNASITGSMVLVSARLFSKALTMSGNPTGQPAGRSRPRARCLSCGGSVSLGRSSKPGVPVSRNQAFPEERWVIGFAGQAAQGAGIWLLR
jgi:hypothetical protein